MFGWIRRKLARPGALKVMPATSSFWVPVVTTVILSLSDQMLLAGLSMMIAGFTLHCSISVYHAGIVIDLAWFAAGAHLLTLGLLHRRMKGRERLRTSRVILMIVMAAFLIANTISQGHWAWFDSGPFNAQCPWNDILEKGNVFGGEPKTIMVTNLVLIFVLYSLAIASFYSKPSVWLDQWLRVRPRRGLRSLRGNLRERRRAQEKTRSCSSRLKRQPYIMIEGIMYALSKMHSASVLFVQGFFGSVCIAFVLDVFWFAWGVKNITEDRRIPSKEASRFLPHTPMEGDEQRMGFGQIIPILLLGSTVFVAIEAYEGKVVLHQHRT